jgi:phage terminase large subunit-like protein
MKRSIANILVGVVFISGCASQQLAIPPGEDREQLVAAIARHGREGEPIDQNPPDPQSPATKVAVGVITTTAKAGATCIVLGPLLGVATLALLAHANLSCIRPSPEYGNMLAGIWSGS